MDPSSPTSIVALSESVLASWCVVWETVHHLLLEALRNPVPSSRKEAVIELFSRSSMSVENVSVRLKYPRCQLHDTWSALSHSARLASRISAIL